MVPPQEQPVVKPPRPQANGVKKPGEGTKCRAVWDWCDSFGSVPTTADAKAHAEKVGWNINNTTIEVSQWKRFHGIARPTKAKEATTK